MERTQTSSHPMVVDGGKSSTNLAAILAYLPKKKKKAECTPQGTVA